MSTGAEGPGRYSDETADSLGLVEPRQADVHLTLEGHWGWHCDACGAQSRYVYDYRAKAQRLAREHRYHCRGRRPLKGVRS